MFKKRISTEDYWEMIKEYNSGVPIEVIRKRMNGEDEQKD